MATAIIEPNEGERPCEFADRLGRRYSSRVSAEHKKEFGQYFTPVAIGDFMASLISPGEGHVRILEPCAGMGVLACALCERLASQDRTPTSIALTAYEVDRELVNSLGKALHYLKDYLQTRGVHLAFDVHEEDFIPRFAPTLNRTNDLPGIHRAEAVFDAVIANPPYFKLAKSDPRALAVASVVHGQPNIYALFMAISASLLKKGGEAVFITPRSFTSGPYFRRFRAHFFESVRPEVVHVFQSRKNAFRRDSVLQENIILKGRRCDGWMSDGHGYQISISSSDGGEDIAGACQRTLPMDLVLDMTGRDKVLRVPANGDQSDVIDVMRSWPGSLAKYGLRISTGPVVPFRARKFIVEKPVSPLPHSALLWLQNVRAMEVTWPITNGRKPQYIRACNDSLRLLVPNRNYVLLRRFSAKEEQRRLIAAPYIAGGAIGQMTGNMDLGIENHLNYIHRPGEALSEDECWGLAALYNSALFDSYFRALNGNTQVSATEIQSMPLPPLKAIIEIGRAVRSAKRAPSDVESLLQTTA